MSANTKPRTKPELELVYLTPDLAKQFVSKQTARQRPVSKKHVDFLSHLIRCGEFDANNGDCLRFDTEGYMFDGGHRCAAVIQTGQSLWVWTSKGWHPNSFLTVDQGKSRSLIDYLKISGETDCNNLSAAVHYAYAFGRRNPVAVHRRKLGALRAYNWFQSHKGIRKLVRDKRFIKAVPLVPKGMLTGIYYVTSKKDSKWADELFLPLTQTEGGCRHGVTILRQRLVRNLAADRYKRVNRQVLMAWLIKLWNYGDNFDPRLRAPDFAASLEYSK